MISTRAIIAFITLVTTATIQQVQGECKNLCDDDDRRLAHLSDPLQQSDMNSMLKKCNNLDYNVAGVVSINHLGLAATPNEVTEDCPVLFLDDDVFNHGKRITAVTDASDTFRIEDIPKYELGTFSLANIFQAFGTATDSSGKAYDLLGNNCGKFMISMMDQGLNVPVTSDHIAFVADSLLQEDTRGWITSTLRAAERFMNLLGDDQTPDDILVHQFVTDYVYMSLQ